MSLGKLRYYFRMVEMIIFGIDMSDDDFCDDQKRDAVFRAGMEEVAEVRGVTVVSPLPNALTAGVVVTEEARDNLVRVLKKIGAALEDNAETQLID